MWKKNCSKCHSAENVLMIKKVVFKKISEKGFGEVCYAEIQEIVGPRISLTQGMLFSTMVLF